MAYTLFMPEAYGADAAGSTGAIVGAVCVMAAVALVAVRAARRRQTQQLAKVELSWDEQAPLACFIFQYIR